MQNLTPTDLAQWLADETRPDPLLLDVREAWEVEKASLPGIVHVPMQEIRSRIQDLDDEAEIVCICHHGGRSAQVAMFLQSQGFGKLHNLQGGMDAWARQVDPAVPTY